MNIRIPHDMMDFIDQNVENGEASSRSDYVYRLLILAQNKAVFTRHIEDGIRTSIKSQVESPEYQEWINTVIDRVIRQKTMNLSSSPPAYAETEP